MLGYEPGANDPSDSKYLMFGAGYANEDQWLDNLKRSWVGTIKCEEEIPIVWTTSNGTTVTGRPDTVLCDTDSNPQLLLEHKLVSAPFSAYNKVTKNRPDSKHVLQAAHYMMILNVAGKLVYTSRTNFMVGYGGVKSNWQRFAQYLNEAQFYVMPFILDYDISFVNDRIELTNNTTGQNTTTRFTGDGITQYYEMTSKIGTEVGLGPRPVNMHPDGEIDKKAPHKQCDYCPLAETCDRYEGDYSRWLDEAILECESES
jgi:hypothetical protein